MGIEKDVNIVFKIWDIYGTFGTFGWCMWIARNRDVANKSKMAEINMEWKVSIAGAPAKQEKTE